MKKLFALFLTLGFVCSGQAMEYELSADEMIIYEEIYLALFQDAEEIFRDMNAIKIENQKEFITEEDSSTEIAEDTNVNNKRLVCEDCERIFNKKCTLSRHRNHEHYTQCPILRCTYSRRIKKENLPKHMLDFHGKEGKPKLCPHPGCGLMVAGLAQHMKTHAAFQEYWKCKHCPEEKSSYPPIRRHLKKAHNLATPWQIHYIKETR